MWGDNLRIWFELFSGIVVYRITNDGPDNNEGWININEFEKRFIRESLIFADKPYDPSNKKQRNALIDAIIHNASLLCEVKLLERPRNITPPSLDYRVTKLGRKIDAFGYGISPGFRKKTVFFIIYLYFWVKKYWKFVTIGTLGWTFINSFKFYTAMFGWLRNDLFAIISAIGIGFLVWFSYFLKSAPKGIDETTLV